jgi:PD-(D/E)XK nuclease superfamily
MKIIEVYKMQTTFKRIYDLVKYSTNNPLEDYLTELIAPIFKDEKFLSSFLQKFTYKNFDSVSKIRVSTQKTYVKIFDHDKDSRPDLVITFENKQGKHIIFFENKLGSGEGHFQLQRYYDHLNIHQSKGYFTYLFYVTEKYDPKEKSKFSIPGTKFIQIQWFQVYDWLEQFVDNLYIEEVLKYMEANEMNKSRKFSPTDIHSLQNLYHLQSMLDETLNGKLKSNFETLFGKPMQWINRAKQLRDSNRYVLFSDQSDWKFIGCGFWFTEDEYPEISVFLEVSANCRRKDELLKAIEIFCSEYEGWEFEGPEDEKDEFIVYTDRSMLSFLSEPDHIESIQNHIIERLKELHTLKTKFPELKWEARG